MLTINSFYTPLQAARDGRAEIINYRMFKLGRSGTTRRFKTLNKLDDDGVSPLHYAVRYGHINVVKLLVENGAGKLHQLSSENTVEIMSSIFYPSSFH